MATWRWGRKATFAAYRAKETMTVGELVEKHRGATHFIERNALVMSPKRMASPEDRTPALLQMMWDRYGVLPRHLVFVVVNHVKAPYVEQGRYKVTTFYRDRAEGGVMHVELSFGFMEEPDIETWLEDLARHKQIDLPPQRRKWIVHVSNENLLPSRRMGICPPGALPLVPVPAPRLASGLLLLWPGQSGAALGRDFPGSGEVTYSAAMTSGSSR